MISFKNQTIVVIRPAWIDERGTLIPDWVNAIEHTVPGCRVQPVVGQEIHANRDAIVTRWNLFGPPAADIESTDRIRHQGEVYEVDGDIRRWPSPTGALANTQTYLRKVDG